ncbi:MAG: hypothetical protein FK731_00805 [Asgard group archaeon]|nr:hypothetical protein [Asgard group archaeon]
MKFIMFWDYDPKDLVVVLEKMKKLVELQKENPQKYPEIICGPFLYSGESSGLTICLATNDEQIVNLHLYYQPELELNFMPVVEIDTALKIIKKNK